jgi:tRNA1(Val) A37 N6-methylase TrmN6
MGLMFARLARNFIKNGYFPTDEETLRRVIQMVRCSGPGPHRFLDPCCGEGTALADLRQGLLDAAAEEDPHGRAPDIEALGIEFDQERAWHAKRYLSRVIHSDFHDVVVKARSIGLMFLNPPYGYGVSDHANRNAGSVDAEKAERLERTFLFKCTPLIAHGGVLVFIVPHYALDDEIRVHLARNYEDLQVFMAPEQQFKQCVVVARRRKAGNASKQVQDVLARALANDAVPVLPEEWVASPYVVPAATEQEFNFHAVRIDAPQLGDELERHRAQLLWSNFGTHFRRSTAACRPPLRELTPWHLALSLAAGQVTGRFRSAEGREFLLKGDTYKQKQRTVTMDVNEKGEASEVITMLDRFVPVINAIEFTPDHRLGQIVKIA